MWTFIFSLIEDIPLFSQIFNIKEGRVTQLFYYKNKFCYVYKIATCLDTIVPKHVALFSQKYYFYYKIVVLDLFYNVFYL
jgi:hypothetical protein